MMRQTRVRNAATGWTMRIEESEFRALDGRLKSALVTSVSNRWSTIQLGLIWTTGKEDQLLPVE